MIPILHDIYERQNTSVLVMVQELPEEPARTFTFLTSKYDHLKLIYMHAKDGRNRDHKSSSINTDSMSMLLQSITLQQRCSS